MPSHRITPRRSSSTRTAACSITGGYVVRDPNLASLAGRYIYVDYCIGAIRSNIPAIPDAMDDRSEQAEPVFPDLVRRGRLRSPLRQGQGSGNNVFRLTSTDPPQDICPAAFPLPTLTASVSGTWRSTCAIRTAQELDGQTLPQGAYKLEIDDNSAIHNFHLTDNDFLLGPSFSCVPVTTCATDIADTGHETWIVNFTTGGDPVTYQCDAHPATMKGTFTISGPPPPPPRHRHLRHRHRHRHRHLRPAATASATATSASASSSSSSATSTAATAATATTATATSATSAPATTATATSTAAATATAAAESSLPCPACDRDEARPRANEDPPCPLRSRPHPPCPVPARRTGDRPEPACRHDPPRGTRVRLVVGRR